MRAFTAAGADRGGGQQGQDGGGDRQLVSRRSAPVRGEERAGRMDQSVQVVVSRRDTGGELLHGTGIHDVEHDRFDGRGTLGAGADASEPWLGKAAA